MYVYNYFAGWCNGSISCSERETAGSIPAPATITDLSPLFDAVKGGGEVKKKQRCLLKRFAALVSALVICLALCVPCFASNNASTKKWVVAEEATMPTESGANGKYFKLSPYVNGEVYAAPITTNWAKTFFQNVYGSYPDSSSGASALFACPVNYPDWWRSAIPLGGLSYVTIDNVSLVKCTNNGFNPDNFAFYFYSSQFSFVLTQSTTVGVTPTYELSSPLMAYPITARHPTTNTAGLNTIEDISADYIIRSVFSPTDSLHRLQQCSQIVFSPVQSRYNDVNGLGNSGMGFSRVNTLYNLSSDDLVILVLPYWDGNSGFPAHDSTSFPDVGSVTVTAVISFWIDANKLPSGLKVGDEFPADTDAFDQLREDLIEQFPEAGENIENGKDTIQGWNDTETVDTDVASTSISALNAMFQNLGGFLFIVSLMVFGAVVLRMLIRKAVDG